MQTQYPVENLGELYRNGRYIVTGSNGFFSYSTKVAVAYGFVTVKEPLPAWRVVDVETRKIASPEFYSFDEALLHTDSLVAARSMGLDISR